MESQKDFIKKLLSGEKRLQMIKVIDNMPLKSLVKLCKGIQTYKKLIQITQITKTNGDYKVTFHNADIWRINDNGKDSIEITLIP